MIRLVHLSDLHFGPQFVQHLADLILQELGAAKPDLVIVSGDWTMRGRRSEYEQARSYLRRLPNPVLTIPGNHDQPLHWGGIYERLVRPWGRYQEYIHAQTDTAYQSPGLFVAGMNDNHNLIPGGIWSPRQRKWLESEMRSAPAAALRVLVMHHHLLWEGKWRPAGQWFPVRTLKWLASLGIELILNGHTHIPLARQTPEGIVVAQSGTSISTRTREGHGNTFNVVEIDPAEIRVELHSYSPLEDRFVITSETAFARRVSVGS